MGAAADEQLAHAPVALHKGKPRFSILDFQ